MDVKLFTVYLFYLDFVPIVQTLLKINSRITALHFKEQLLIFPELHVLGFWEMFALIPATLKKELEKSEAHLGSEKTVRLSANPKIIRTMTLRSVIAA